MWLWAVTVDHTEALVVGWERAFREADSHEKFQWLMAQANERGQRMEALCGLVRSTYASPHGTEK